MGSEIMQTALYLRKSRAEEQTDTQEETLRRHKELLTEYASKNKITILKSYEEVVSGESLYARPQMLLLLEAVERGDYDAVLCMDIDRLGRGGMRDQGIILDAFKYSDTKIITPEKIYNLNDEADEEITEFKTFMSRRELKIINKRLRRGIKQTLCDGGYIANAPYGYVKTTINKKPTLEIVEGEAYFVRMMFEMYANGYGSTTIANTINSLGAKPHRTDKFGRTSVMHILKNPVFVGKIVWNRTQHIRKNSRGNSKHILIYQPQDKWTITDGIHPAIISNELFEKVQKKMSMIHPAPSKAGILRNPLAGLITCGNCGHNMQLAKSKNKYDYIQCIAPGCISGASFSFVQDLLIHELHEKLESLKVEITSKSFQDTTLIENLISITKKEIADTQTQKNALHDLLEKGVYSVDVFKERIAIINKKLEMLYQQETTQTNELADANAENKISLAEKIENVLSIYDTCDIRAKNNLLKSIIKNAIYRKESGSDARDFTLNLNYLY